MNKINYFHIGGSTRQVVEPSDNTRVAGGRPVVVENKIRRGAANTWAGASPLEAFLGLGDATDPRNDNYNPHLITGVAPAAGPAKVAKVTQATRRVPYVYSVKTGMPVEGMSPAYTLGPEYAVGYRTVPVKVSSAPVASPKPKLTKKASKSTSNQSSNRPDIFNIQTGELGWSNGFTPEEGWAWR